TTQADTRVMRVARQASAPATGGFVFELQAQSEEKGEDTFEERLAIAQQLKIGCFVLKIDGEGPVFTGLAGSVAHGYPSSIRSRKLRRHHDGNALQSQDHREGHRELPRKAMECAFSCSMRCGYGS